MKTKTYRFFYHYFKQKGKMSVHFRNTCTVVDDIKCVVPCETKWNKRQPYLVMQGHANEVVIKNNIAYIL
jgi:hypothetical protein